MHQLTAAQRFNVALVMESDVPVRLRVVRTKYDTTKKVVVLTLHSEMSKYQKCDLADKETS